MAEKSDYILELLLEYGLISQEQADEGWDKVGESEGRLDILDALKELGYVHEHDILGMLAQQYGLETLDLSNFVIPQEILDSVPKEIPTQYNVVPVMLHDGILTFAMSDPTDMETLDSLRLVLKRDVDAVISPQEQIQQIIDRYYSDAKTAASMLVGDLDVDSVENVEAAKESSADAEDSMIIRLVYMLIAAGHAHRPRSRHRRSWCGF